MEWKFTKQLKEDWIKALQSGEYEQFPGTLRNPENHKQCCCLGVLACIHPDMDIADKKDHPNIDECGSVIVNGKIERYNPFNEMGIHSTQLGLTRINDESYYYRGARDYSEIIPIIETIETED